MSDAAIVAAAAALWVALGITLTFVMGRRGHTLFGWAAMGGLLGPFALLFAVEAVLDEKTHSPTTLQEGVPSEGVVDVIVGIDGSAEAAAALRAAVDLLGSRIHRLTLAGVVRYDDAWGDDSSIRAELDRHADIIRPDLERLGGRCNVVLLTGRADRELAREAAERGYDLIVIGARGQGLSKAFVGSVATKLSAHAKVPVLISGSSR